MSRAYAQMKMLQTFFNELENTDEIAKSPFRKLGRERKKAGFEFPILRNLYGPTDYNAQIKYLLTVCKINRTVAQFNEQTQQNEYVPLHSVGGSKLARKTHVDMMNLAFGQEPYKVNKILKVI